MRQSFKRLAVPYLVAVIVAALCVPLLDVVNGPTVLGIPWWFILVALAVEMFGLWWAFIRGEARTVEETSDERPTDA